MEHASLIAITHLPPASLERGERSYVGREPIDFPLALWQHTNYCALLRTCGAEVVTLTANAAYPDAVFVEDTAVVLDEVAVIACPGAESRRDEPDGIAPELAKYRTLRRIAMPATLDGGDVVVTGRTILVGASARTNEAGARALQEFVTAFGYRVVRVGLRDCLHLKSACCALPDGRLLVNPQWLADGVPPEFERIAIQPEEPFAADFATVNGTVIMSATNPRTADATRKLGFDVKTTALTEFEKAEGGVTCLSIIFRAPVKGSVP